MNAIVPASIAPADAGEFCFNLLAHTDIIGGTVLDTKYRTESVRVDPLAPLDDDCLVVMIFKGGTPFMARYVRQKGRNIDGRFVKAGSPDEAFMVGLVICDKDTLGKFIHIVGRVVGPPREFPLQDMPAGYYPDAVRRGREVRS